MIKNLLLLSCFLTASILEANTNELEKFNNAKNTISFTENKGQVSDQNYNPRPDVLFSGEGILETESTHLPPNDAPRKNNRTNNDCHPQILDQTRRPNSYARIPKRHMGVVFLHAHPLWGCSPVRQLEDSKPAWNSIPFNIPSLGE